MTTYLKPQGNGFYSVTELTRQAWFKQAISAFGGFVVGVLVAPWVQIAWLRARGKVNGTWSSLNSETSGVRFEKELPSGPHELQLYSCATPAGQRVSIALEELGLSYDAFLIDIAKGDQFSSGFVALNPNSKIPALIDRGGAEGREVHLFESGAILLYLAEKTGKLIPKDPVEKQETIAWLFFQIGASPYFGQYAHFIAYAPATFPYSIERYKMEVQRLFDILEKRLAARQYLVGTKLTIADIAWFPWINSFHTMPDFQKRIEPETNYPNVEKWYQRILTRKAVQTGLLINNNKVPQIDYIPDK